MSQKLKDIYVVVFDDYVGFYRPAKCPSIGYAPRKEFKEFVSEIHHEYPEYRIRNVLNKGIVDRVKEKIAQDNMVAKLLQNSR